MHVISQICERFPLKGQSLRRQQLRTGHLCYKWVILYYKNSAWQLQMILKVKPDQSILVRKLQALGVTGHDLDWFISYLDNRQQQIFFNGALSSTEHTISGVLRGLTLGPLLFLVYIYDLPWFQLHYTDNYNLLGLFWLIWPRTSSRHERPEYTNSGR